MVARVWRGYTKTAAHADAYEAMLKPELLPGISTKKGYCFDTLDDIKALTGPDYETAVIPPERRQYLSRFDAQAVHYEVAATHKLS